MDWTEALEATIARTGHARYRELCHESHPDHLYWRARVIELETGAVPTQYPPVAHQAVSVARALWDWACDGLKLAPEAEYQRRLATCEGCPLFDRDQKRCAKCGCYTDYKLRMRSERCPEGKW